MRRVVGVRFFAQVGPVLFFYFNAVVFGGFLDIGEDQVTVGRGYASTPGTPQSRSGQAASQPAPPALVAHFAPVKWLLAHMPL
jgi:hypothetical protein